MRKFKKFLAKVDERNALEEEVSGTAIHGITQFSDLSDDEFEQMYLSYELPSDDLFAESEPIEYNGAATAVNWAGLLSTPVKNQGYCGSCWAFAVVSQIETEGIKAGLLTASDVLSTQQLTSCDTSTSAPATIISRSLWNKGCSGGNLQKAYQFVFALGGVTTEALYPYTSGQYGYTGTCDKTKTAYKIKVATELGFVLTGEAQQIAYVLSKGPLTGLVNANTLGSYKSGIVSAATCSITVNHGIQIVGVDTVNNYWIIRNSWGASWGLAGYYWLELNKNACGIARQSTYINVVKA